MFLQIIQMINQMQNNPRRRRNQFNVIHKKIMAATALMLTQDVQLFILSTLSIMLEVLAQIVRQMILKENSAKLLQGC